MAKKKESLLAGYMSDGTSEPMAPSAPSPKPIPPQKEKRPKKEKSPKIQKDTIIEPKPKKEKKTKPRREKAEDTVYLEDKMKIKSKMKMLRQKAVLIAFVLLSLYMGFLIIGIISSTYIYDENGEIVLKKVTVDDIQEEKEYKAVLLYYVQMKELYEEVILLDYELEQGTDNYITLASEYEELTTRTEEIFKGLNALSISRKYDNIILMMKQWIYEDMPVYLQNISGAISANDAYKAEQAILGQSVVNSNFNMITTNIVGIGRSLGYDVTEYEEWSVEKYRKEKIGIEQ